MAIQFSETVRNARLDQVETTVGTSPQLEIRTGAPPADTSQGDSGTLLVSITLPSDWMANASGGSKAKSGTWEGTATASGDAAHFRVKGGGIVHIQGTVTATGGGGDLTLDNVSISTDQTVTISTFTLTDGNA